MLADFQICISVPLMWLAFSEVVSIRKLLQEKFVSSRFVVISFKNLLSYQWFFACSPGELSRKMAKPRINSRMKIVIQVLSKSIVTVRKMCTTLWKESRLKLFAHHESANVHRESSSILTGKVTVSIVEKSVRSIRII